MGTEAQPMPLRMTYFDLEGGPTTPPDLVEPGKSRGCDDFTFTPTGEIVAFTCDVDDRGGTIHRFPRAAAQIAVVIDGQLRIEVGSDCCGPDYYEGYLGSGDSMELMVTNAAGNIGQVLVEHFVAEQ